MPRKHRQILWLETRGRGPTLYRYAKTVSNTRASIRIAVWCYPVLICRLERSVNLSEIEAPNSVKYFDYWLLKSRQNTPLPSHTSLVWIVR
ncbi:hypothetical protein RRG08_000045 [Elysia crispata]|uniref:Uncharacterized protein n=1 Tax=Elysia crispata TaxID=231223 RepID=A0AAE1CT66_9GAST|nr:hypothetical protein RRG08_000045 [Elysia crispata]